MSRWLAFLLVVLALAAGLRAWRLDFPGQPYFDEIYYVGAARNYLSGLSDENNVHPPLAKQTMAVFLAVAGDSPAVWRLASFCSGMGTLLLTAYLAYLLTGRTRAAVLAATLLSLDFLHLVQCRIAMLDGPQSFWIMAALAAVAYTATRPQAGLLVEVVAGLCFGCATACKWNGLFALAGGCVALGWTSQDWRKTLRATLLYSLGVVLVYLLSYAPLLVRETGGLSQIVAQHRRMWDFRYDPKQFHHRYLSGFYSWPLGLRPVWYRFEEVQERVSGIVAMGCPLFWWLGLMLVLDGLFSRPRRSLPVTRFALPAFLFQWLLWAVGTTGGFLYYMVNMTPMLAVLIARELDDWWEEPLSRGLAAGYLLMLVLALACYYPLLTGLWVHQAYFRALFFLPGWT